jgi:F-type H+-transporting ATPase subunit a
MSCSLVGGVVVLGLMCFQDRFLVILVPSGIPIILGPLLIVIETMSHLIRALSLGIRLGANISAGHLLISILGSFVFDLLFKSGNGWVCFLMVIMCFICLMEIMVACIQAYVFSLLTTIYLGDTISIH